MAGKFSGSKKKMFPLIINEKNLKNVNFIILFLCLVVQMLIREFRGVDLWLWGGLLCPKYHK